MGIHQRSQKQCHHFPQGIKMCSFSWHINLVEFSWQGKCLRSSSSRHQFPAKWIWNSFLQSRLCRNGCHFDRKQLGVSLQSSQAFYYGGSPHLSSDFAGRLAWGNCAGGSVCFLSFLSMTAVDQPAVYFSTLLSDSELKSAWLQDRKQKKISPQQNVQVSVPGQHPDGHT